MNRFKKGLFQALVLMAAGFFFEQPSLGQENGDLYRWDIATVRIAEAGEIGGVQPGASIFTPGGTVVATGPDNRTLTLTGSGLFQADQIPRIQDPRIGKTASGGGTWILRDPPTINFPFEGTVLASGRFTATELIHFQLAPGRAASDTIDTIGAAENLRPGLAILRIQFSDGSQGTLTIQTRLAGTPLSTTNQVHVVKGAVEYTAAVTEAIHVQR